MTLSVVTVAHGRVIESPGRDQVVPWWSFTKTIIAAAALILVRDGRLSLDEPRQGERFTLRQLLQHRAGVPNYGDLPDYHLAVARDDEPWTTDELLRRVNADHSAFVPGMGWDYSNVGYLLVGQLIEEETGESLGVALRKRVLAPLGLDAPRLATARSDLDGVEMGWIKSYHPGWVYHGLLVGGLADAALALDRLLNGDLLPADLLGEMHRVHPLGGPLEGRPWLTTGYGLGLMIGTGSDGLHVAGHTGGGPGSVIAVYRCARSGRTAAAFLPGDDTNAVESKAFEALA